jgi:hypothetical protein
LQARNQSRYGVEVAGEFSRPVPRSPWKHVEGTLEIRGRFLVADAVLCRVERDMKCARSGCENVDLGAAEGEPFGLCTEHAPGVLGGNAYADQLAMKVDADSARPVPFMRTRGAVVRDALER